jgi:hypothetical protein
MPATSALQAGPAALISGCDSVVTSSTTPVDAQQQRQREQGSEDVSPASRPIISDRATVDWVAAGILTAAILMGVPFYG